MTFNPLSGSIGHQYRRVFVERILEDSQMAICRDSLRQELFVPLHTLRAKSAWPAYGETWMVERTMGDWTFAAIIGYVPPKISHAEDVGDGAATSYAIHHNLKTKDVIVQVFNKSAPYGVITPSTILRTDVNTVTLTFSSAPSTAAYRVVILSATS
jgi:hypothetical protein